MIRYLISQGADVHAQNGQALMDAVWYGHLDMVKYLISQGADVNAQEDLALIFAAQNGHSDVISYLITQGADVRAREDEALNHVALDRRWDVLSFLLDMYEDPGHLHTHTAIGPMMNRISRERSFISSSLRAGANIANLISAYY